MIRIILTLSIGLLCTLCSAQRDSSLTEEFGKLSAKQRTRIALKEQEDAAKDTEFNALMAKAERLFQARSYDDALAVFKEARRRRPYNVHPKVKIQDLEAFIKERDRKKEEPVKEATKVAPVITTPTAIPIEQVPIPISSEPMTSVPTRSIPSEPEAAGAEIPIKTINVPAPDPKPKAATAVIKPQRTVIAPREVQHVKDEQVIAASLGERIYKEGSSIVIERTIQQNGRSIVYRKVFQPSGAIIHFEDGIPITQREWDAVFYDR